MKKIITLIVIISLMAVMSVAANAAFGTVVEADKIEKAPNLEEIDESWGDAVVVGITSATENTYLWKYWNEWADTAQYEHSGTGPNGRTSCEPEDLPIDVYIRWDNKNLYFGVVAMDEYLSGSENTHRGDGIKLWIQPAEAVDDPTVGVNDNGDNKTFAEVGDGHPYSNNLYIWTLGFDDWSTDTEDASSDLMEPPVINADFDDRWQAIIAIPWSNLGYRKTDVVDGVELAIAFMRISSTGTLDEGYSGGLCWGKFMKDTEVWGKTTNNSLNTLILRDPDAAPATEEPVVVVPETEVPQSGPVAQIGDVVYDTFAEAVAAAREGDTIYLLRDAKEDDVVVSREIFFMINGEGGRYPNVTAGEGFTMKASGSPFNEYLGAYHFESVSEAPATEAPATEAPATEAPATEASVTEVINTDPPVIEPVDTETPATENPDTEEPAIGAPTTETAAPDPDADDEKETAPATEAPVTEPPVTDAPATEAPVTAAPATETPATEAPVIDVPVTEEPAIEPDEKSNTGLVIAIVAVVVVVGTGLGIVLGKKKK